MFLKFFIPNSPLVYQKQNINFKKFKQLIFSTIVLEASSFTSIANEAENKKTDPCVEQWVEDMSVLMDGFNATFEEAEAIADQYFNKCLDYYYPIN